MLLRLSKSIFKEWESKLLISNRECRVVYVRFQEEKEFRVCLNKGASIAIVKGAIQLIREETKDRS
jgi:hypothetical protein